MLNRAYDGNGNLRERKRHAGRGGEKRLKEPERVKKKELKVMFGQMKKDIGRELVEWAKDDEEAAQLGLIRLFFHLCLVACASFLLASLTRKGWKCECILNRRLASLESSPQNKSRPQSKQIDLFKCRKYKYFSALSLKTQTM